MSTRSEAAAVERFSTWYRAGSSPVMAAVERDALGADYGATGYTTREQADVIARHLRLSRGQVLLDVGAGSGWPGLYLSDTTGCRVVGTDLPFEGLQRAQARARGDGLADRASFVVASGRRQPLRPAAFDAIVHTDVLCCLGPKLSVLRMCRRLLRPGGRLAFTTIKVASGLAGNRLRRACQAGPVEVSVREAYSDMVAHAGFTEVLEIDVTPEYAAAQRAWFQAFARHEVEVSRLWSPADFAASQADRRKSLEAIEEGLRQRSIFVAVRPSR